MPINRHCLLIFALSAALLTAASADPLIDKSWPSNVGPTRLSLPIPDGYEEATQVAPALRQFGERLAPPVNRVLAYFVSTDDVRALRASASGAEFKRYFLVETLRQAEQSDISPAEFSQAQTIIRDQYKHMLPDAAKAMKPQIDSLANELRESSGGKISGLKVGELRGLDIFIDDPQAISLLAVTKVTVQTQDTSTEVPMALALNTVLVGGKLVYLYVYTRYAGDRDLDWARAQSKVWLDQAAALNR